MVKGPSTSTAFPSPRRPDTSAFGELIRARRGDCDERELDPLDAARGK
jgi:hypothetical protein